MFISNNSSQQHHSIAKEICLMLILLSLVGCSVSSSETKTKEPIMTPTILFTSTLSASPTVTPIPKPVKIGSLGRGVMSDVFRSPDDQLIAIGIRDYLHWYDSKTFKEMGSLQLGMPGVMRINFSPDGKLLGVESGSSAQVVNLDSQEIVATIKGFESAISDLAITPDNQYIVFKVESMRHGDAIGLWNIGTDEIERYFDVINPDDHHLNSTPAISPDGKLVAAGNDKQVYIWELDSGRQKFILNGHALNVSSVTFAPDGMALASGSQDGTVRLWDLRSGVLIQVISGMGGEVYNLEFSPDGRLLEIYSDSIYHWDLETRKLRDSGIQTTAPDPFTVQMHLQGYSQNWLPGVSGELSYSPDGNSLALGSESILIWDLDKGVVDISLENSNRAFMTEMQYSPNGRWFAAKDDLRNLQVWDVQTGQTKIRRENDYGLGGTRTFAFSPSSSTLALASRDELELWDIDSSAQVSAFPLIGQETQRVTHLAFSPDGSQLHAVLDSNDRQVVVKTWDVATSGLQEQFELPENSPGVFSATGLHWPYFARNNADNSKSWIEVWNLETKQIVSKPQTSRPETEPLQFSPDGRLIMAISDSRLYAWDTATGQRIFMISQVLYNSSIAISPDNKTLAIEQVGKIELWDTSQIISEIDKP